MILPFAGFTASRGDLDPVLAWAAATVGAVLGAYVLYAVGALIGYDKVHELAGKRWFVLFGQADLARGERLFSKHGSKVVLLGRFIPFVRSVASVPAGYRLGDRRRTGPAVPAAGRLRGHRRAPDRAGPARRAAGTTADGLTRDLRRAWAIGPGTSNHDDPPFPETASGRHYPPACGPASGCRAVPAGCSLVLLYAVDIKTAGSLSLAVSLPTMLGLVPGSVLIPLLAAVLLVRARKVWGHR